MKETVLPILLIISFCHMLNDLIQSLLPAMYPVLKESYHLNFAQVGAITLAFQMTASLLQPIIGLYTDKRPKPFALPVGMGLTLAGLVFLSQASSFSALLLAAALVGTGSSVFHPESSRVAHLASGGRHGFAQSLFQVGGIAGGAFGPLLVAFFVLPRGQGSLIWFSLVALLGMAMLMKVSVWYKEHASERAKKKTVAQHAPLPKRQVVFSLSILVALIFSKHFYLASINSYYTFYLIQTFGVSVRTAQIYLFAFVAAGACGAFLGGPIGDRIGRKYVIWASILGVLPFTLLLPYANLFWTGVLSVLIAMILSSAFPAIVVYAQELMPGKVGAVSGLFFGLAFGMAGVGAGVLGVLADHTSIGFVYHVCSFLPAIGLLAFFLPHFEPRGRQQRALPEQALPEAQS